MNKVVITAILTAIFAVGFGVQSVLAIPAPCGACGASEFAPGKEKQSSDFESKSVKQYAPGQEASFEPVPCDACSASESAPGHEAQEAGIIGPEEPDGDFGN